MRINFLAVCNFLILASLEVDAFVLPKGRAFAVRAASEDKTSSELRVSNLEREKVKIDKKYMNDDDEDDEDDFLDSSNNIPSQLRVAGSGVPNRRDKIQLVDTSTYEAKLLETWDNDPSRQKGFDWEIEKMRRYAAGLRMRDDGAWVKQPSAFEFLVSKHRITDTDNGPPPANAMDVAILFGINILSFFGLGATFGMAAVPTATIQKYEGSFFSFIKGCLGGDLQTLAGGPLFLLLNKYFLECGPIFNLAFGPKSFLVVSDPIMAKHILRGAPPDQYCKGMLAEILEPIMGKGLIPADPATWKVCIYIVLFPSIFLVFQIKRSTHSLSLYFLDLTMLQPGSASCCGSCLSQTMAKQYGYALQ